MNRSNTDTEKINARSPSKNKEIILYDQICYSWGYSYKKKMVSQIGAELADLGYSVTIIHYPDEVNIGVYKIFVDVNNTKKLVYSNSSVDKKNDVVVSSSPSSVKQQITNAILQAIGEK